MKKGGAALAGKDLKEADKAYAEALKFRPKGPEALSGRKTVEDLQAEADELSALWRAWLG